VKGFSKNTLRRTYKKTNLMINTSRISVEYFPCNHDSSDIGKLFRPISQEIGPVLPEQGNPTA
jgi:hypothetical protein